MLLVGNIMNNCFVGLYRSIKDILRNVNDTHCNGG